MPPSTDATSSRTVRSSAPIVKCAPIHAPGTAAIARGIANDQSTLSSTACVTVPGTASSPTHASELPTASFTSSPSQTVNMGTIRIPPPIPSSPLRSPATAPITTSRHAVSSTGVAATGSAVASSRSVGPRRMRNDVIAIRTAVANMSGRPFPGITSASTAPATEATAPVRPVTATTRARMSPARAYRSDPVIDDGMIDGSVDPTASIGDAPSERIPGVEITAPPTPNIPESAPVANPRSRVSRVSHGSGTGAEATGRPESHSGTAPTLSHMPAGLELRGVYVPLITPFATNGSVAIDAIERVCHRYLDDGIAGIVALGTTGEAAALDADERRRVIDVCGRICAERSVPLIVGAGSNNTTTSVESVRALDGTPGLAAALVVVPYYVRPSEPGIVAHFRAVADASPVPILIYNIGARTGRHLGAAGVLELARTPNVAGTKHAPPNLDVDTLELLSGANAVNGFSVLSGDDAFLFPLVLMGATGGIAASAHLCTRRFVDLVECGLAGKIDDGRAHAEALLPVVRACFHEPNPAVFKGVLHAQGIIPTPDVRLPLVNASTHAVEQALTAVAAAS